MEEAFEVDRDILSRFSSCIVHIQLKFLVLATPVGFIICSLSFPFATSSKVVGTVVTASHLLYYGILFLLESLNLLRRWLYLNLFFFVGALRKIEAVATLSYFL